MYVIKTINNGIERHTPVEEGVVLYEDSAVQLSDLQHELLQVLTGESDTPFLATELRRGGEFLADKSVKISDVFVGLKEQLTVIGLSEHLIVIGKEGAGKSTHYGFLTSLDDETMLDFAHRGLFKIQQKKGIKLLQRTRQEAPFLAFISSIEEEAQVEVHTNKKALAYGGAVIALTLGTAATVYLRHKNKK